MKGWCFLIKCRFSVLLLIASFFLTKNFLFAKESNFKNHSMVITTGLFENTHYYDAFYDSRIFAGTEKADFVIERANKEIFSFENTLFFSNDEISKKEIIDSAKNWSSLETKAVIGHSYFGIVQEGSLESKVQNYLGAASVSIKILSRKNGEKTIYAVLKNAGAHQNISWPTSESEIRMIPGVVIKTEQARVVVAARAVGRAAHKLGIADEILKKNNAVLLDVGSNSGQSLNLDPQLMQEAKIRNIVSLAGTSEMGALGNNDQNFTKLDLIYPFKNKEHKVVNTHYGKLNLWSLGDNEQIWSLFRNLGDPAKIEDALSYMGSLKKDPKKTFNVVRVFSERAAAKAARSVYVDLVLLVSADPYAQLPTREQIDLRNSSTDAFEQVAPIISLSTLSVAEVVMHQSKSGVLERVEVIRHAVSDQGPKSVDLSAPLLEPDTTEALPSMNSSWEKKQLDEVAGGFLLKSTQADVALFESNLYSTPIKGALGIDLALARLKRPGIISVIKIPGLQLKKIARLIMDNKLNNNFVLYGMDPKGRLIRERTLNDEETYALALSENALLEIFGVSRVGGFTDAKSIRAPFIESVYGKLDNLLFLSGAKTIAIPETERLVEGVLKNSRTHQLFLDAMAKALKDSSRDEVIESMKYSQGKPGHSLYFNVNYLDFGFSHNLANQAYIDYKDAKVRLPMSRAGADLNTHLLIYSKLSLTYDAPGLITTLSNGIRFLAMEGFDKKPAKDKFTLGLDFRLPWERGFFKDKSVVISPIFKNVYETKLAPFTFLSKNTEEDWKKLKMIPRTNKLDSLLGLNFNMTNLGFEFDVGAMMATDFRQDSVREALDFGPGLNFSSKWKLIGPLELSSIIKASYLFPLPDSRALGKAALGVEGTVWLRVAHFYNFSLSLMNDFLLATLQDKPKVLATSSIFGVTISYGNFMRIF